MKDVAAMAVCGLAAYLLGAIPFGYLIGRARGIDIRRMGSGNIGATNLARCAGRWWGVLAFAGDAGKGFLAAWLLPLLAARFAAPGCGSAVLPLGCACLAVAGHNWPVYLGFRGGKGVATSAGALLALVPLAPLAVGLACWTAIFLASGYVSLASIATAVVVAASAWLLYGAEGTLLPATLTALAALAVWRHRGNIRRLLDGTEHRFNFRRRASADKDTERRAGT